MNKMDFLTALTQVDEEYIAEAAPPARPRRRGTAFRLALAAACLALALGMGLTARFYSFAWPDLSGRFPTMGAAGSVRPYAAEMSITVSYNSCRYTCKESSDVRGNLGGLLERRTIEISPFGVGTSGKAEIDICRIAGISPHLALAVGAAGGDSYRVYYNEDYFPQTLGQWKRDLGVPKEGAFSGAVYRFPAEDGTVKYIWFPKPEEDLILGTLFGSDSLRVEPAQPPEGDHMLFVRMRIPAFPGEEVRLYVTEDGFVYGQTGHVWGKYSIGKQKARRFIQKVLSDNVGYELDFTSVNGG